MSGLTPARLDSFCHAMEAAGLVPPDPIIADGTLHRFPTNGRPDDDAGWYVLYGDGIPAGTFGCWRYGVKESWCAKSDQQMTRAEWTAHQRRIEKIQRDREAEDQRRHAEAAAKAQWIWDSATPAPDDHPYLQRKQVKAHGLRVDDQHGLLIPVMINGAISSLQFIDANGGKLLLYGGAKKGGSFTIGTMTDNAVICIAEGYATAATIHEATGYPAVVAFDAGNLLPVAQALRAKNHDVTIIVCADNDVRDDGTPNTGREDATAAAEAIGGVLALPELDGKKCDFNDVHVQRGLDAVEAAIDSALQEQATMMTPTLSVEKIPEAAHYTPSAVTAQLHTEPTREEALIRLAQLSPADYGAARKAASATLGIPLGFLDKEWEARRAQAGQAGDAGHGLALEFEETVPAFEPVDGADLADRLAATFTKFTVLPDHGAVALTLWVLFTYCLDLFQIAPRLDLSSPEKRCGKTTVLSLLSRLVARAALASNIRPAVLFRVIAAHKPSLLIDEMDTFIDANDELRGLLNSGHTRDAAMVIRCEGDDHDPRAFSTWAAMAFAHIGKIPDTLEDRSVRVLMRRRLPNEHVASLRQTGPDAAVLRDEFSELRRQTVRWITDHSRAIAAAAPPPVEGLHDRANDNWTPLLAIAHVLGGAWPDLARQAAKALSGASTTDNESIKVELLADIQGIFAQGTVDRVSSAGLCDLLALLEERPWGTWKHGKPMTPVQLARLLRPFGVTSRTVRLEGQGTSRGYLAEDFSDAFSRYIPTLHQDSTLSKRHSDTTRAQSGDDPLFQGDTEGACVTSENGLNPAPRAECVTVSLQKGEIQEEETLGLFSEGSEEVFDDLG